MTVQCNRVTDGNSKVMWSCLAVKWLYDLVFYSIFCSRNEIPEKLLSRKISLIKLSIATVDDNC